MSPLKKKMLNMWLFSSKFKIAEILRRIVFSLLGCRFHVKGKGTNLSLKCIMLHCSVDVHGNNNTIEIGPGNVLKNVHITVLGNNNHIHISSKSHFTGSHFACWDDGNTILVGKDVNAGENTSFVCMEGTRIVVGDGSLFSYNVEVRTSDSHSILDKDGIRINPARDIYIGKRVWIAQRCLILKGSSIADDCIVGANSVTTKKYENPGCLLLGQPAVEKKTGLTWSDQRI